MSLLWGGGHLTSIIGWVVGSGYSISVRGLLRDGIEAVFYIVEKGREETKKVLRRRVRNWYYLSRGEPTSPLKDFVLI